MTPQELHNEVVNQLKNIGVVGLQETFRNPNKWYGINSSFYFQFDIENEWNYTIFEFLIDHKMKTIFIRGKGYFHFSTIEDVWSVLKSHNKVINVKIPQKYLLPQLNRIRESG